MGEDESDNDGCEGTLSSTDDLAHVDRDFDVSGRGRDESTIDTS